MQRDDTWITAPAATLVQGDVAKLSLGAVVAADVRLAQGSILVDKSMLTGESLPVEAAGGAMVYAGNLSGRRQRFAREMAR